MTPQLRICHRFAVVCHFVGGQIYYSIVTYMGVVRMSCKVKAVDVFTSNTMPLHMTILVLADMTLSCM